MIAFNSLRLGAYFAARRARFFSRSISASLATVTSVSERELEAGEQSLCFVVGLRSCRDADVQPTQCVDLVVVDFGENDLLFHTDVVVAATIERTTRHATEVAHTGERNRHETVQKFVHCLTTQRDHCTDRIALTDLEASDCLACLRDHWLLAGNLRQVANGVFDDLLVSNRFAKAHVRGDLGDARHFHHGLVTELLGEAGYNLLFVKLLQTSHFFTPQRQALSSAPVVLRKRTFLSPSTLMPTRDALPFASTNATFEICSGIVLASTPPVVPFIGFGLTCFLTRLIPSTVTRSSPTDSTTPRLPLSLPVVTITSSPLRILFIATPYSTSGASETIFINRSLRNSRVTGPKIRVPIGSSLAFKSTAALPSNLISEPSWRRTPLAVRTTTAL